MPFVLTVGVGEVVDELPVAVGESEPAGEGEMVDAVGGKGLPVTVGASVAMVGGVPGATLGAEVVVPRALGTDVTLGAGVLSGASVAFDDGVTGAVELLGGLPGDSVELPGSPSDGIPVPVTFNTNKFSSAKTSSGIVPVRPALSCSSRISKRVNKPNSVGMVPVKKFVPNRISVSVVINPISVGKVPSTRLESRLKTSVKTQKERPSES